MSQPSVTIVDYGMCNLLNVARAFEHCGAQVTVTEDPKSVAIASRLVVPGVGAFSDSMKEVNARGLGDALKAFSQTTKPMFGICVGMQMLFDTSEEFGNHAGLGILPGRVQAVPSLTKEGKPQRVPHIGWNHLIEPVEGRNWDGTLLEPMVDVHPAVYFVHSFSAVPEVASDRLADCLYGGHRICAAVQREHLMASQFHPERSGEIGLAMVRRFLTI
jgi:imidazole glycerol-phosphate synthase subunit HisH